MFHRQLGQDRCEVSRLGEDQLEVDHCDDDHQLILMVDDLDPGTKFREAAAETRS